MKDPTICSLFKETAEALAANDLARLIDLSPLAARVKVRSGESAQALRARNALDGILKATAGNLRLLQRVRGVRGAGYEAFRP